MCDPADVTNVERAMAQNPNNLGVGIIDKRTGAIRIFPYNDTDAFSLANPQFQLAAGHEAAAAMAGCPSDDARGFILAKQGTDWHIVNGSHLNRPDGQANAMRMDPRTFAGIVSDLQAASVQNLVIQ